MSVEASVLMVAFPETYNPKMPIFKGTDPKTTIR